MTNDKKQSESDKEFKQIKNENDSLKQHNKTQNHNFTKTWKPYKYMKYHEKKKLLDQESYRDHYKQVKLNIYHRIFKIIRFWSKT